MVSHSTDSHQKAVAAGLQLQQALNSAADALTTIANIVPSLFLPTDSQQSTSSTSLDTTREKPAISAPSSTKRKRKEKEPGAPEKPLTAYHLYAKENKDQVKEAMGGQPTANEVILEVNRKWKELSDELKKPFIDAAEKLKSTYKQALSEYERGKEGTGPEAPTQSTQEKDFLKSAADSTKTKSTQAKGGFTAVKATPLVVNPEQPASEDDSEDEAAVAADLGGNQPSALAPPSKRQRKEVPQQTEGKKERKEKSKDKDKAKEKDKDKERKRRRKSNKGEL